MQYIVRLGEEVKKQEANKEMLIFESDNENESEVLTKMDEDDGENICFASE